MKEGQPATATHDYIRHGTTTLFAALNVPTARCWSLHAAAPAPGVYPLPERRRGGGPGRQADPCRPGQLSAHKHPKVWAWLERHPRSTFHFTPTSCSWLNAVEGFFAVLTKRRLRRGSFSSLVDLQAAINRYLDEQHGPQALRLDRRAGRHHREGQARVSSVSVGPLGVKRLGEEAAQRLQHGLERLAQLNITTTGAGAHKSGDFSPPLLEICIPRVYLSPETRQVQLTMRFVFDECLKAVPVEELLAKARLRVSQAEQLIAEGNRDVEVAAEIRRMVHQC